MSAAPPIRSFHEPPRPDAAADPYSLGANPYSWGGRRSRLRSAAWRLALRRRSREAVVGRVGRRRFGVAKPLATRSAKRAKARSRLRAWERSSWATATTLGPTRAKSRLRWASLSVPEASTSKLASTREAVTFACCPPGPEERLVRTVISAEGSSKSLVTRKGGKTGDRGIEPRARVLETPMLPLHQSPKRPVLRAILVCDTPEKVIAMVNLRRDFAGRSSRRLAAESAQSTQAGRTGRPATP